MSEVGVPALRFAEFEGAWESVRIQKLIDQSIIVGHLDGNHGELYPTSDEFSTEGVPYIAATDIVNGAIDFDKCKKIPELRASQFKKGIARDGDLIFAHNATVGPTVLLQTKLNYVILSTTVTYFRFDNSQYLAKFALQAFHTKAFVYQYSRVMSQSTRDQVPISMQRRFTLPFPSPLEQQKIADFLGAVDARVGLLRRRRDALRSYKKGMMQRLFSQELRFTKPDGSPFPDWQEKRLGEVARKTSSSLAANMLPDFSGQYPIFGANGFLGNLRTYENEEPYIAIVKDGAGVGRVFMCPEKSSVLGTLDQIHRRDANDIKFIYYFLAHFDFLKYVAGSTIPHIYFRDYGQAKLCVPHPEEQLKIAHTLTALDAKIDAVTAQMDAMLRFKNGLLQQMFV